MCHLECWSASANKSGPAGDEEEKDDDDDEAEEK
jgi:hypothetical protein